MSANTTYYVTIAELAERTVRVSAVTSQEAAEIAVQQNAPCVLIGVDHWSAVEKDS